MSDIATTVSFGILDGTAVFMDMRSDSYSILDPKDQELLLALVHRNILCSSDERLLQALELGDAPVKIIQAEAPSPSTSLVERSCLPSAAFIDVAAICRLIWSTRSQLRRRHIASVLACISAAHTFANRHNASEHDLLVRAGRFLAARPLVPARGNCLLDSLALLRWLQHWRAQCELIFGVKLNPFAAHCWVQSNGVVLNDRLETVAAFTPVSVIRCSGATL